MVVPIHGGAVRVSGGTFADIALRRGILGSLFLSAVVAIGALIGVVAFGTGVVTTMLIAIVAVIGLQVFFGNSGILSFGHAGFVALGAYASGILTMDPAIKATTLPDLPAWLAGVALSFPFALLVTGLLVGAVAAAIGAVIVRLGGYSAAIASLGVLVIVHAVLLGVPSITRGAQTFYGIAPMTDFTMALAVGVAAVCVGRLFRESRAGLQLRASREDELAARSFGVNVRLRRLQAWTLGAAMAGISGALLAHFITAFSPKQFYFALTFNYLVMLIIGGPATVAGAVGGAAIVIVITEVLRGPEAGFQIGSFSFGPFFGATQIILALLMLLVMYFRRDGLFGLREPDELLIEWLDKRHKRRRRAAPAPGSAEVNR
jgi:branched-chain amino acid transport system permease protein